MRALVFLAAVVGLCACVNFDDDFEPGPTSPAEVWDAEREAARRCPLGQVAKRNRSDGTSPSHYDCERPGQ